MMTRDELLQWITGLPEDAEIGIDDGGLCLQTKTGEDYLEIGGLPEELDDYEAANSTPTFVYGDRVKCSAEGLNTFTKYTSTMRGVIVSKRRIWPPQANKVVVKWDHLKTPVTLASRFLAPAGRAGSDAGPRAPSQEPDNGPKSPTDSEER